MACEWGLVGGFAGDAGKASRARALCARERVDVASLCAVLDELPFKGRVAVLERVLGSAQRGTLVRGLFEWSRAAVDEAECEADDFVLLMPAAAKHKQFDDLRQWHLSLLLSWCPRLPAVDGLWLYRAYVATGAKRFRYSVMASMAGGVALGDEELERDLVSLVAAEQAKLVRLLESVPHRFALLARLHAAGLAPARVLFLGRDAAVVRELLAREGEGSESAHPFVQVAHHGAVYVDELGRRLRASDGDPLRCGERLRAWEKLVPKPALLGLAGLRRVVALCDELRPREVIDGCSAEWRAHLLEASRAGTLGGDGVVQVVDALPMSALSDLRRLSQREWAAWVMGQLERSPLGGVAFPAARRAQLMPLLDGALAASPAAALKGLFAGLDAALLERVLRPAGVPPSCGVKTLRAILAATSRTCERSRMINEMRELLFAHCDLHERALGQGQLLPLPGREAVADSEAQEAREALAAAWLASYLEPVRAALRRHRPKLDAALGRSAPDEARSPLTLFAGLVGILRDLALRGVRLAASHGCPPHVQLDALATTLLQCAGVQGTGASRCPAAAELTARHDEAVQQLVLPLIESTTAPQPWLARGALFREVSRSAMELEGPQEPRGTAKRAAAAAALAKQTAAAAAELLALSNRCAGRAVLLHSVARLAWRVRERWAGLLAAQRVSGVQSRRFVDEDGVYRCTLVAVDEARLEAEAARFDHAAYLALRMLCTTCEDAPEGAVREMWSCWYGSGSKITTAMNNNNSDGTGGSSSDSAGSQVATAQAVLRLLRLVELVDSGGVAAPVYLLELERESLLAASPAALALKSPLLEALGPRESRHLEVLIGGPSGKGLAVNVVWVRNMRRLGLVTAMAASLKPEKRHEMLVPEDCVDTQYPPSGCLDLRQPGERARMEEETSCRDYSVRIAKHLALLNASVTTRSVREVAASVAFVVRRVENEPGISKREVFDWLAANAVRVVGQVLQLARGHGPREPKPFIHLGPTAPALALAGALECADSLSNSLFKLVANDLAKRDSACLNCGSRATARQMAVAIIEAALDEPDPEVDAAVDVGAASAPAPAPAPAPASASASAVAVRAALVNAAVRVQWALCAADGGEALSKFKPALPPARDAASRAYASRAEVDSQVAALLDGKSRDLSLRSLRAAQWHAPRLALGPAERVQVVLGALRAAGASAALSAALVVELVGWLGEGALVVPALCDYVAGAASALLGSAGAPAARQVELALELHSVLARFKQALLGSGAGSKGKGKGKAADKGAAPRWVWFPALRAASCALLAVAARVQDSATDSLASVRHEVVEDWLALQTTALAEDDEMQVALRELGQVHPRALLFAQRALPSIGRLSAEQRRRNAARLPATACAFLELTPSAIYGRAVRDALCAARDDVVAEIVLQRNEARHFAGPFAPVAASAAATVEAPFSELPAAILPRLAPAAVRAYGESVRARALSKELGADARAALVERFVALPTTNWRDIVALYDALAEEPALAEALMVPLFANDDFWRVVAHLLQPAVLRARPSQATALLLDRLAENAHHTEVLPVLASLLDPQRVAATPLLVAKNSMRSLVDMASADAASVLSRLWALPSLHADLRYDLVRLAGLRAGAMLGGTPAPQMDELCWRVLEEAAQRPDLDTDSLLVLLAMPSPNPKQPEHQDPRQQVPGLPSSLLATEDVAITAATCFESENSAFGAALRLVRDAHEKLVYARAERPLEQKRVASSRDMDRYGALLLRVATTHKCLEWRVLARAHALRFSSAGLRAGDEDENAREMDAALGACAALCAAEAPDTNERELCFSLLALCILAQVRTSRAMHWLHRTARERCCKCERPTRDAFREVVQATCSESKQGRMIGELIERLVRDLLDTPPRFVLRVQLLGAVLFAVTATVESFAMDDLEGVSVKDLFREHLLRGPTAQVKTLKQAASEALRAAKPFDSAERRRRHA